MWFAATASTNSLKRRKVVGRITFENLGGGLKRDTHKSYHTNLNVLLSYIMARAGGGYRKCRIYQDRICNLNA